ncbi:22563_t:CDS:1, partial [Gigaspora rosea]
MQRRDKSKYRIVGIVKKEGKEKKEVLKIANEVWLSKEKICLTVLAIMIVIRRDKVVFEIETDIEVIGKILDKICSTEYEK